MAKKSVFAILVGLLVLLSGCATSRRQKGQDMEMQGLRNQITVLEAQIQAKDEEINSLNEMLAKDSEAKAQQQAPLKKRNKKARVLNEAKSRPNVKQIQIALTNAGFEPGVIDGKKGKKTIEAIRAFQKAQGLPVTGKADKATWKLLKGHLYKNIK
ncbi:MAG: hypothetical protein A3G38_02470 [Omnitrophica WOR_2 bacterium RIFCSPLOWO2_12_FULL_51_8]|nr:MAG: hypothetical protein A3G38_02470 [Omnitrophica WOR_2 bacterium RIFCSPLOWO2_12_FULL_51_8]